MRNIRHIQYLVLTAEYGSYATAAKALFISEPSLWKAIKDIEKEYGITVFKKSSRSLTVTEEGKEFLIFAQKLLDQMNFIDEYYEDKKKNNSTCFFVSSQHYHFVVTAFQRMLLDLKDRYNVGIREGETIDIFADVSQGFSDIGVIYISNSSEKYMRQVLKNRNLEFTKLKTCKSCVYISKKSPLAKKKTIKIEDLQGMTFVYFQQKKSTLKGFSEEVIDEQSFAKRVGISDKDAMEDIISGNPNMFGVGTGALVPHSRLRLCTIPLFEQEEMDIGWIKHADRTLNDTAKLFLKYLDIAILNSFALKNEV